LIRNIYLALHATSAAHGPRSLLSIYSLQESIQEELLRLKNLAASTPAGAGNKKGGWVSPIRRLFLF
jgi:hypothetical protein